MSNVAIRPATSEDIPALSALAERTFPLATPSDADAEDFAAFVAENLSPGRFAEYLADDGSDVAVAEQGGTLVGYTLLHHGFPGYEPVVENLFGAEDDQSLASELSKIYVDSTAHGGGIAQALMDDAQRIAYVRGSLVFWLGVNDQNQRAQRFYEKSGLRIVGPRTFTVGSKTYTDHLMGARVADLITVLNEDERSV